MVTGMALSFIGTFFILGIVYLFSRSYQKTRVNKAIKASETYSPDLSKIGGYSVNIPRPAPPPTKAAASSTAKTNWRRPGTDIDDFDDDFDDDMALIVATTLYNSELDEIYAESTEDGKLRFIDPPRYEEPVVSDSFEETVRPEPAYSPAPAYEAPSYTPPSYGGGSSYESSDSGGSYDSGGSD